MTSSRHVGSLPKFGILFFAGDIETLREENTQRRAKPPKKIIHQVSREEERGWKFWWYCATKSQLSSRNILKNSQSKCMEKPSQEKGWLRLRDEDVQRRAKTPKIFSLSVQRGRVEGESSGDMAWRTWCFSSRNPVLGRLRATKHVFSSRKPCTLNPKA